MRRIDKPNIFYLQYLNYRFDPFHWLGNITGDNVLKLIKPNLIKPKLIKSGT